MPPKNAIPTFYSSTSPCGRASKLSRKSRTVRAQGWRIWSWLLITLQRRTWRSRSRCRRRALLGQWQAFTSWTETSDCNRWISVYSKNSSMLKWESMPSSWRSTASCLKRPHRGSGSSRSSPIQCCRKGSSSLLRYRSSSTWRWRLCLQLTWARNSDLVLVHKDPEASQLQLRGVDHKFRG
jgi:hypothetical protein